MSCIWTGVVSLIISFIDTENDLYSVGIFVAYRLFEIVARPDDHGMIRPIHNGCIYLISYSIDSGICVTVKLNLYAVCTVSLCI